MVELLLEKDAELRALRDMVSEMMSRCPEALLSTRTAYNNAGVNATMMLRTRNAKRAEMQMEKAKLAELPLEELLEMCETLMEENGRLSAEMEEAERRMAMEGSQLDARKTFLKNAVDKAERLVEQGKLIVADLREQAAVLQQEQCEMEKQRQ